MKLTCFAAIVGGIAQIALAALPPNGRNPTAPPKKPVEINKAGATPKSVPTKPVSVKYGKDELVKPAKKKKAPVSDLSNTAADIKKPEEKPEVKPETKKPAKKKKEEPKKKESKPTARKTPSKSSPKVEAPAAESKPAAAQPEKEQKPEAPAAQPEKNQKPEAPAQQPKTPAAAAPEDKKPEDVLKVEQSGNIPIQELIATPSEAQTAEPFDAKKHEEARKDLLTEKSGQKSGKTNASNIVKFSTSLLVISLLSMCI